jgi:glycosyltransferase involved in cell wall biosynthesis
MKVSVLICTRNRAESLRATLARFFEQKFSGPYEYELVVVDNQSTDHTYQVVADFIATHNGHNGHDALIRYVQEPRKGLCYARNTAVCVASGELIVFTDDDVLVSEDWLDEIQREFSSDPQLCLLGGRVLLAREELQRVAYQPANERQEFTYPDDGGYAMGANMAFRREVFDRVGLFDVRLGAGRFFAGADEVELFYRALKAGYRLLYAPNVLVYHDHDRFKVDQACRLEYGYGKGCAAYLIKHSLRGDTYAMRVLYWMLLTLPGRWKRKNGELDDTFHRRRALVLGLVIGVITAPLVMWTKGKDAPN